MVDFLRGLGALGPDDTYVGGERTWRVRRPARRRAAGRGAGGAGGPLGRAREPARLPLPVRAPVGPGDADVPAGRAAWIACRARWPTRSRAASATAWRWPAIANTPGRRGGHVHRGIGRNGARQVVADYCVCTIPPMILPRSPTTSRPAVQQDLADPAPGLDREDRAGVPAPVLGGGRSDVRRHHQHEHGHRHDLVPVAWVSRRARCRRRLLQLRQRRRCLRRA